MQSLPPRVWSAGFAVTSHVASCCVSGAARDHCFGINTTRTRAQETTRALHTWREVADAARLQATARLRQRQPVGRRTRCRETPSLSRESTTRDSWLPAIGATHQRPYVEGDKGAPSWGGERGGSAHTCWRFMISNWCFLHSTWSALAGGNLRDMASRAARHATSPSAVPGRTR